MDRVLSTLGKLLRPADPAVRSIVVAADDRWTRGEPIAGDAAPDAAAIVWGRTAAPSGTSLTTAGRGAIRRELAIAAIRIRPPAGLRVTHVHRLGPQRAGTGWARRSIRRALLSGAMVELVTGAPGPRVLDRVLDGADVVARPSALRLSSGGAAVVRGRDRSGRAVLVRLASRTDPADPAGAIEALRSLEEAGVPHVPRLLRHGVHDGLSWTVESVLPGRRPDGLTDRLVRDVADLLAGFPRIEEPPTSLVEDLEEIAGRAPTRAERVSAGAASLRIDGLPSVLRHGDLWAGNLLTSRGALSGVVDWDAWHPRAVPGADLLELVASGERMRARRPLGTVWCERPWNEPTFREAAKPYWDALRMRPSEDDLEIVGIAWWAAKVAGTLRRLPARGEDERWLAEVVDPVLERLPR
jgi:Phosphotransferase enzyme family